MNTSNVKKDVIDMETARKLWIHCNYCFVHFVDKVNTLFLLACKHVVCMKCVTMNLGRTPNDEPTYTCPMCRQQVRGRQVNNDLPTNLKDMFHPTPWADGLPYDHISSFQKAHFNSLDQHLVRKEREAIKLDKDIELAKRICQKHYLEMDRLRMERKQLEFHLRAVAHQAQIRKEEQQRRKMEEQQRRKMEEQQRRNARTSVPPTVKHEKSHNENRQKRKLSTTVNPQSSVVPRYVHKNNHSFFL